MTGKLKNKHALLGETKTKREEKKRRKIFIKRECNRTWLSFNSSKVCKHHHLVPAKRVACKDRSADPLFSNARAIATASTLATSSTTGRGYAATATRHEVVGCTVALAHLASLVSVRHTVATSMRSTLLLVTTSNVDHGGGVYSSTSNGTNTNTNRSAIDR